MSSLDVVGGVYHEKCLANDWDHLFGSAGRAAAAVKNFVPTVRLHTYLSEIAAVVFAGYAGNYAFELSSLNSPLTVSFEYVHSLSEVVVRPSLEYIPKLPPIKVEANAVLRFGMLESTALVNGNRVVYDPQSESLPEPFAANGSSACELAIVANEIEIQRLGSNSDVRIAARNLLLRDNCSVVVVKAGPLGAIVITVDGESTVPAFETERVWTLGTGDVFAAIFAATWAVSGEKPIDAALAASKAVAHYVETRTLPIPPIETLHLANRREVTTKPGKAYIAGPFFNMKEKWLIEECVRCLTVFGIQTFSPMHDVGLGFDPTETASRDLKGLESCDRVFALVDGGDVGTIYEIGYARAKNIPVYAYGECLPKGEAMMLLGTGCRVDSDFVSALHHLAWQS